MTALPISDPPEPPDRSLSAWERSGPEEQADAELLGLWPDPFAEPPADADAWLADLTGPAG